MELLLRLILNVLLDEGFWVFLIIAPLEIIAPHQLWYNYHVFWAIGYPATELGAGYNGKDPGFFSFSRKKHSSFLQDFLNFVSQNEKRFFFCIGRLNWAGCAS